MPVYFPEKSFSVLSQPSGFDWPSSLPSIKAVRYGRRFECSHSPEDLIDPDRFTQTMYVDVSAGVDGNSGTSWANRKSNMGNAYRAASASGLPTRILAFAKGGEINLYRQKSMLDNGLEATSAVPIMIEAIEGRMRTGVYDVLTFAKTVGYTNVYEAVRTNGFRATNPAYVDIAKAQTYKEYAWVSGVDLAASIALVDATEGSWYLDSATGKNYVHPHGHEIASNYNVRIYLQAGGFNWGCNQDLFIRGFDQEGGQNGALRVRLGSTNKVVLDDCTLRYAAASNTYAGGGSVIDTAQILGVGLFAAFNTSFDMASKDGVNLHADGGVIPSGLLVNCSGKFNGLPPSQSNNGFTTHDGVKSISIGCTWTGNRGTNSGHVGDGTQIWSVGDIAGSSAGDVITGGSINWAGFGVWAGGAKIWLDSCRDVGSEIGVYSSADPGAAVYLRNHKGTGKRVGNILPY
jgi:hypothetical protein